MGEGMGAVAARAGFVDVEGEVGGEGIAMGNSEVGIGSEGVACAFE